MVADRTTGPSGVSRQATAWWWMGAQTCCAHTAFFYSLCLFCLHASRTKPTMPASSAPILPLSLPTYCLSLLSSPTLPMPPCMPVSSQPFYHRRPFWLRFPSSLFFFSSLSHPCPPATLPHLLSLHCQTFSCLPLFCRLHCIACLSNISAWHRHCFSTYTSYTVPSFRHGFKYRIFTTPMVGGGGWWDRRLAPKHTDTQLIPSL